MKKLKFYAVALLIVLPILAYFTTPWWTHNTAEVTVVGAVPKDGRYLVMTTDGVYKNTDTWYYFKFDSSDVQAKLMVPGRFRISYYGFRIPFLSQYKNIVSATRL